MIVIDDDDEGKPSPFPTYTNVVPSTLTNARQVVVSQFEDLDKAYGDDLSTNLLAAWAASMKQGLSAT